MPRDMRASAGNPSKRVYPAGTNFKLIIEYDGGAYHGWQRQPDRSSIQETIEDRVSRMTGGPVTLTASGRTDAGVHALGQTVNFYAETRLGPEDLKRGLNRLLPGDIVIHQVEVVAPGFHSRYDAKQKTYRYHILNRPLPMAIGRQYRWHVSRPLDVSAMTQAAAGLVGTHDFKSFEGAGSPRPHTIRTVHEARIDGSAGDEITFTITANGFLRFMVRNIVGTLVEVGLGKRPAAEIEALLALRNRCRAGTTAPSHGLFLVEVVY